MNIKGIKASRNKLPTKLYKKKLADTKKEQNKFKIYYERWFNQSSCLIFAINLTKTIEKSIESFNKKKGIPLYELEFLREAARNTVSNRRFLKSAYMFSYYLIDTKVKEKKLFRHELAMLESHSDHLHELLESETISALLLCEDPDEFQSEYKQFKEKIFNLTQATKKFSTNLMKEAENNLYKIISKLKLYRVKLSI